MAQFVSIRAVASRLKSQFKVDMDIYDVVQACSEALKRMGCIALQRSVYKATINNYCINLPGSVWKVRGVIRLDEPVLETGITVVTQDIYFPPQIMFEYDEPTPIAEPYVLKANYVPQFKGPYIDYVWDCPVLKFNETDIEVAVEVTGIKTDKEGFPMIPEAVMNGCLYYALYVYYQPLFLLKQIDLNMMRQVEEWKDRNMAQANHSLRMEALTANERDNLMDILTSMDRKSFRIPS